MTHFNDNYVHRAMYTNAMERVKSAEALVKELESKLASTTNILDRARTALKSWKLYAHFVGWPNQTGVPELLAKCINEGEDALRALGDGATPSVSTPREVAFDRGECVRCSGVPRDEVTKLCVVCTEEAPPTGSTGT